MSRKAPIENRPEADNRKTPRDSDGVDSSCRSAVRGTGHTGPRRRHPQTPTVRPARLALALLALFALAFAVLSSTATAQAQTATNGPPEFADETADRSVPENSPPGTGVGEPVAATDADNDALTYSISGTDASLFRIDSAGGQITVRPGTVLDYETRSSYAVTVTASDPSGASDTITVAIMVTDVRVSEDAAVNVYDANKNEMIDKSEVIDAIRDYLNYEIEKGFVLELIGLYFGPTPTPAVALVLDSEATVTGYWSDGSANVKVTVSLRNEGNLQLSSPVQVAVTCSQDGEA